MESGFKAIVLTVDMPYLGRRERDLRTGFAVPAEIEVPSFAAASAGRRTATLAEMVELLDPTLSWRDVEELAGMSGLPLVVKGVLGGEDARLARESGAAGIVVSNHGGRQLDGVMASLDALPEVVEAVDGAIPVLVDGGVRRGIDVARALALGAQAVMVGRPVVWGWRQGARRGCTACSSCCVRRSRWRSPSSAALRRGTSDGVTSGGRGDRSGEDARGRRVRRPVRGGERP